MIYFSCVSSGMSSVSLRQMNPFDAEMNKISVQIIGLNYGDKQLFVTIICYIFKLRNLKIYNLKLGVLLDHWFQMSCSCFVVGYQ